MFACDDVWFCRAAQLCWIPGWEMLAWSPRSHVRCLEFLRRELRRPVPTATLHVLSCLRAWSSSTRSLPCLISLLQWGGHSRNVGVHFSLLPTSNLLSTFWVSFKHSQSDSYPHPPIHSPASCIASLSHISSCPPGVPHLTRLKPPTSVLLPASLQGYLLSDILLRHGTIHREIRC